MSNGYFEDSDGDKSFARLAAEQLILASIICAFIGKYQPIVPMLTSATLFYLLSKARQGVVESIALKYGGVNATTDKTGNP